MNLNKNTYLNFDFDSFITDEAFQDWVIDDKNAAFWTAFLIDEPEKAETIYLAKAFILNIGFVTHSPANDLVERSFAAHMDQLNNYQQQQAIFNAPPKKRFNLLKIAAVWALFMFSAGLGWYLYDYNSEQTYHTAFGETRRIHLPDNSVITLQANSTLHYAKHWGSSKPRQVWLDGEAYFTVKHINKTPARIIEGERFIVNTHALNVEVLGTVFNVKERHGVTAVVLESGKVKVTLNSNNKVKAPSGWYLKPGEGIRYNQQQSSLPTVAPVNVAVKTAWAKGLILFDGLTTKDLVDYLADNYGYQIIVKDTSIYKYQLSGKLKLESERDLIFTLENVLKLDVQKTDSTLTIQKRHPN